MRNESEDLDAEFQLWQERLYALTYAGTLLSMEDGEPDETIRAEILAFERGDSDPDPYQAEVDMALIQNAIEDALACREPRYPAELDLDVIRADLERLRAQR